MILDGREVAAKSRTKTAEQINKTGIKPVLAVVLVGTDPASVLYTRLKHKACKEAGIESLNYELSEKCGEAELLAVIDELNEEKTVDGILVQLPLPQNIDSKKVLARIAPEKDVDGLSPANLGSLVTGEESFVPCTPKGILSLFKEYGIDVKGKRCVIVGDSVEVGKPLAICLLNRSATVFICNKHTPHLGQITREADVLVSATGVPSLIKAEMVKKRAVVVDVGISKVKGVLAGDVDFERVKEVASAISPVPGGVGPMTIAMLLENTLAAAENRRKCTGKGV